MNKPLIGITPLIDKKLNSYCMIPGYMDACVKAGGLPMMLPFMINREDVKDLVSTLDGIVLTGGPDVPPSLYGEEKKETCGNQCPERDELEKMFIDEALLQEKPILAICRGFQYLNVLLGGSLYQDIPTEYKTELNHCQEPPYDIAIHRVTLPEGSPLRNLLQKEEMLVNSYHHQAIKKLGEGLKSMGESTDGIIEAFYMPERNFVWGVQWHPEFIYKAHDDHEKIFQAFIESMRK